MPMSRLAPLLAAVAFLVAACDYDGGYRPLRLWPITVENHTGIPLDVVLDGRYRGTVAPGTFTVIPEVEEGPHLLEAVDGGGAVRASFDFYLDEELVWVLE